MIVFVSVLAPRIVRPPPGEIAVTAAVVNISALPAPTLALSPPDVALRPSRVVNAPSVINAHEVRLSPPTVNLRPARVVGAASVVNVTVLEKEPELVPDAAVPNVSVVNDSRLVADQNLTAALITNVSSVAGAEVAVDAGWEPFPPGNTEPGVIFVLDAEGAAPASTAPGEIFVYEAAA